VAQTAQLEVPFTWPVADTSRVPYRVYTDPALYALEQERLFQGPVWNFLGLDVEIPNPGDYKTTFVGDAPVIMLRTLDGRINAVMNRCEHKGSLLCYKPRGHVKELTCVYHNWTYDLDGKLTGVAFRKGVGGKGGVDESFDMSKHNLVRLRVETYRGLVFGTFSDETPDFRTYLGDELIASIDRVFIKPLKVLGYHSQMLPNNWKLYAENNKDSYHASLLHVFHNTFGVVRPNMGGGIKLSESGWHHLSYTERTARQLMIQRAARKCARSKSNIVSMILPSWSTSLELGDLVTNSIQTIFPNLVVQQILNALAVRQLLPKGVDRSELVWTVLGFEDDTPDMVELRLKANNLVGPAGFISMEDGCVGGFVQRGVAGAPDQKAVIEMGGKDAQGSESRVTEASIRGFWKAYRAHMGL